MVRRLASILGVGLRRALYPLVALPLALASLALLLVGRHRAASAVQLGLLRRLLGRRFAPPSVGELVAYLLLILPGDAVALVVAGYLWLLVPVNLGYPLRPDTTAESVRDAWGGPTLAGAWAVHAVGAVLIFVLVGLPILNGVAWLQGLLAKRMLGPRPRDPGRRRAAG
jgi:hypothetical protein